MDMTFKLQVFEGPSFLSLSSTNFSNASKNC